MAVSYELIKVSGYFCNKYRWIGGRESIPFQPEKFIPPLHIAIKDLKAYIELHKEKLRTRGKRELTTRLNNQ